MFNFTSEEYSDFIQKSMLILEAGFNIRKLSRKAIENIGCVKIDLFLEADMLTLLKMYKNRKLFKLKPLGKLQDGVFREILYYLAYPKINALLAKNL